MKFEHVLCVIAGVGSYIGIACLMTVAHAQGQPGYEQSAFSKPPRFAVMSQQYVESGAKIIVLRDTRQPDRQCYVIYEAGAGVVLDTKTPCN